MTLLSEGLKLPAKISEIFTTRAKLRDSIFGYQVETGLEAVGSISETANLFRRLRGCFPKRCRESSLFREALHRSLENYTIGVTPENAERVLDKLPSALAGNIHTLLTGTAIAPPSNRTEDEHCLSIVKSVVAEGEDTEKYKVSFELLTGLNANPKKPLEVSLYETIIARMMKTLGVKRKFAPSYERIHPRHLVGCYAYIIPVEGKFWVHLKEVGSSAAIKARNKKLEFARNLNNRYEWCTFPECGFCPHGPDKCPLSTRPVGCVKGLCPVTNEIGWTNPQDLEESSLEYQELMW